MGHLSSTQAVRMSLVQSVIARSDFKGWMSVNVAAYCDRLAKFVMSGEMPPCPVPINHVQEPMDTPSADLPTQVRS